MILLLLVVGVLYALCGGLRDSLTIFTVILLLVGAEVVAPKARVRRGGRP